MLPANKWTFFYDNRDKKKTISSSAVHKLSTGKTLGLSYLLCYTENLVYACVGDIMVHIDAADTGVGEVGAAGGDEARDVAAEFVRGVLLYLDGIETDIKEGVWQMPAQQGDVSSPPYIEKCEAFYLGEG